MESPQVYRVHEFETGHDLELAARHFILENAKSAIIARGIFRIVLAGGTTPRNVYRMLCDADADWSAWQVYFGDERCLPADHPERNSSMVRSTWLDHVAIPPSQIHPIRGELGPEAAAASYAQDIANIDRFDLVLLGLGEDGHAASLFPGKDWGTGECAVLAVHDAPKPPPDRVSLSAWRLSQTRKVLFIVAGEAKREALEWLASGERIPASSIRPGSEVDIYTDLRLRDHTVLHS